MAKRITKEEKVAIKLGETMNDLTLDLDEVGKHLATSKTVLVNRLSLVVESALEEKEDRFGKHFQ